MDYRRYAGYASRADGRRRRGGTPALPHYAGFQQPVAALDAAGAGGLPAAQLITGEGLSDPLLASAAPPLRSQTKRGPRVRQVPLGAQLCDAVCWNVPVTWKVFTGEEGAEGAEVRRARIEDEDLRWEAAEDGGFPSGFSLPGWWISFQQWAGFSPFWALINDVVLPLQVEKISPDGKFAQLGFVNAAQVFQSFGEALFGVLADRTLIHNRFGRRRAHVMLSAIPDFMARMMMWYSLSP